MFTADGAFSGFSVDDLDAAERFYRDVLGLTTSRNEMGMLLLHLGSGGRVLVYPKPDHEPASFTILDFPVDDVDAAVDDLRGRGVDTTIYNASRLMPVDAKGVMRGHGPDIAWFTDPAGNVLAVVAAS
ncbi:VOC family protein [Galbitalea sp. SE-J8]|uniref:VOC family protein n=1 Tax=Galbitalea sp. SE-J8 TaxID=3054952 RepID=UPI00259C7CD7|nr:VOC family protein [Galbitalea sp. SE-J8]MDM4764198.1 VOC family protein [Galbitalea sp. SE-J8]